MGWAFASSHPHLYLPSFLPSSSYPISHTNTNNAKETLPSDLPSRQRGTPCRGPPPQTLLPLPLHTTPLTSPANEWALRRTKSVSSAIGSGDSLRRWWDWGWSWILSRKPVFAQDLELNEEETKALGSHSQGSWRHVFYKFGPEIRRLTRPDHAVLQTCRYDSFSCRNNFEQPRAVAVT